MHDSILGESSLPLGPMMLPADVEAIGGVNPDGDVDEYGGG